MVYLLPLLTVLIWGGNSIINKMAATAIEPSAMSFYRWFFAMLLMTPFCLPAVVRQWNTIKPYLPKLALLSLLGMVLNQSLGYYAGLTTTASNMSLIISLVPLISVFISVPLLGKSISMISIVGGIISLTGLTFMLGHGDIGFFLHQDITQGDGLMIIAAVIYATYCVLLKRWKMPFRSTTLIYCQGIFAVMMLTPLWLTSEQLLPTQESLPLIAYAAIAASILAPWMWIKSIDIIGADSSAMFMNLMPVISVGLATWLLNENIHSYHLVGGLMVIAGVILSQVKRRNKSIAVSGPAVP
ncbi:DMT family transporter [Vibrio genomosp. F10]|uniref:Multidrug DMT transporter n=1 Tax=Vibrio genomosp. F10 TaxID=723171 RepID=A0A1B9QZK3_9VIBR|nr:DMT family transporter [Vibrio genomosp. F10]OCH76499.1 multidrug DMT transporter [Vibrio genomosp. F10]OEE93197.1 multidrug DMT transporter [Vibrio genomosp. F10 str. 9ZD137]